MTCKRLFLILSLSFFALSSFAQDSVATFAGNGTASLVNGKGDTATFNHPFGMCIAGTDLVIADQGNNVIRLISIVENFAITRAGSGKAGWKDGNADTAEFNGPADVCVDNAGATYVSDFMNQRIRKISFEGMVSTIAGNGIAGYADGNADSAEFNYPRGICNDEAGNIYIADSWNHRIRKITPAGVVTTYAGGGISMGVQSPGAWVDGPDTSARFDAPSGLAIDNAGNIYVADAYNHRIRKIDTARVVTTIAGSGAHGPGLGGYLDGDTSITLLNTPTEVFVDNDSNWLYISDTYNNRIRKLDMKTGTVSTLAGSGATGFANGIDSLASFSTPRGIAADVATNKVYVADNANNAIRIIYPIDTVTVHTGISNIATTNGFSIYPNPCNGVFMLTANASGSAVIQVWDGIGNKIITQSLNNGREVIDLSVFSKGFYFVQLTGDTGNSGVKKVMVE